MSDADTAFAAAQAEIARVREAGKDHLDLTDEAYSALTTLPEEIGSLDRVSFIELDDTQITDLTPLAPLTGLERLDLVNTPVTNITPLQALTGLTTLFLSGTQVTDIAPLQALTGLTGLFLTETQVTDITPLGDLLALETLSINDTKIADLRPLIPLVKLGEGEGEGLWYEDTPASRANATLTRLSQVEGGNFAKCYRDTRDYLLTLPPYPEPLPWDVPAQDATPDPKVPEGRTAPLQVVEVDGVLRKAAPGDGLAQNSSALARQGWQALREVLEDLSHLRGRVSNAMPTLDRALTRLDAGLGDDYNAMNPVAIGTHGNRVIRQAGLAGEALMDADAAEIQEFAAALSLFLERFKDWRDYRDDAVAHPIAAEDALEGAREIEALVADLADPDVVDPDIPEDLNSQIADVREAPDDPIASTGLVASASNLLAGVFAPIARGWRVIRREVSDLVGKTWQEAKTSISKTLGKAAGPLALAGLGLLWTNAGQLTALASKFPTVLDWVRNLITGLGLL